MSKKPGKNLRVALSGAAGRMGSEIHALISVSDDLEVVEEIGGVNDWKRVDPKGVDVVVDFSTPEGFKYALEWCTKYSKPLVSGTTGLAHTHIKEMKGSAHQIPILYSANMSLGIAVMSSMLKSLKAVKDWDFHIEEAHHAQKKDKPSGTALLLQEELREVIGRLLPTPNSIRGGGLPGEHWVWAMGPEESLVLHHTAFKRTVFARGALLAARWLFDKKQAGLYDLSDLYPMT